MIVVRGRRGSCEACDMTIGRADLLVVVECVGRRRQLRMHAECVAIWQYQCREPGRRAASEPDRRAAVPGARSRKPAAVR
jgi:hypothetical protein